MKKILSILFIILFVFISQVSIFADEVSHTDRPDGLGNVIQINITKVGDNKYVSTATTKDGTFNGEGTSQDAAANDLMKKYNDKIVKPIARENYPDLYQRITAEGMNFANEDKFGELADTGIKAVYKYGSLGISAVALTLICFVAYKFIKALFVSSNSHKRSEFMQNLGEVLFFLAIIGLMSLPSTQLLLLNWLYGAFNNLSEPVADVSVLAFKIGGYQIYTYYILLGFGALTAIGKVAYDFVILGAKAGNPNERSKAQLAILWDGIFIAGLGSISVVIGFFYGMFR